MLELQQEKDHDKMEVEALYDTAFSSSRFNLPSYQFRHGVNSVEELSGVVRDDFGALIGAIRFWPIAVGMNKVRTLLLGPIAVHPIVQGEGIGSFLIRQSITKAHMLGWESIILIGDLPYYKRFGFRVVKSVVFPPPTDPKRVLCLALVKGALDELYGKVYPIK